MVRRYKRKREVTKKENIFECVNFIESQSTSVRAGARRCNVPLATLQRYLNAQRQSGIVNCVGRMPSLPNSVQTDIAEIARIAARNGFGLLREELRQFVGNFVKKHFYEDSEIGHYLQKYCQFKHNVPSLNWIKDFMDNHRLSLRKPSPRDRFRALNSADPFTIYQFYDLVEEETKKLQIEDKPSHIFNCDETAFVTDPSRWRVVAPIGDNRIHRNQVGCGKESYTVLACACADGSFLPPLIVFKAKHFYSNWCADNAYPGTVYAKSGEFIFLKLFVLSI